MSCPYEKTYKPEEETCPVLGSQEVLVGVPVEVKPFAHVGKVSAKCVGKPVIKHGTLNCEGRPGQVCKFTVSQKMKVEVPVMFGTKTKVGEAIIDCKHCEKLEMPEHPKRDQYEPIEESFGGIVG